MYDGVDTPLGTVGVMERLPLSGDSHSGGWGKDEATLSRAQGNTETRNEALPVKSNVLHPALSWCLPGPHVVQRKALCQFFKQSSKGVGVI